MLQTHTQARKGTDTMTPGRPPLGPNIVQHFDADPHTKLRMQVMLQTNYAPIHAADHSSTANSTIEMT